MPDLDETQNMPRKKQTALDTKATSELFNGDNDGDKDWPDAMNSFIFPESSRGGRRFKCFVANMAPCTKSENRLCVCSKT
jgi:hypothetical protein